MVRVIYNFFAEHFFSFETAEGHNSEIDYRQAIRVDTFPSNEVPIYTWLDATLREISELIKGIVRYHVLWNSTLTTH